MAKQINLPVYTVFAALVFICSCSCKPERSRKPVSTIEIIPAATNYQFGQKITVSVKTKLRDGNLRKVDAYLNNQLLASEAGTEFTVTVPELLTSGINTIKVYAEKTDGVNNTRSQSFTVLSDLVPVKYKFEIIREFKHSTLNFTQGLEFKNGVLYEGTGENGKSFIYKIDLSSNKVLFSTALPEKYFGEGITLFNDKVYQLTYRHQTGFIYNQENLARIDSFRFESKEGWGLTHDNQSLIMSDGTGTLSWLNPVDFTVVKRIQVVDHQKVYQNLNELEYDNGTIWANIWTSDQIIRIDANTGKILGYLDLKGIMGIMPANSSERIDVLNGIALIPHSGHLLVTGKLWPKMFEIKVIKSE